jgi:exopolysaccharide biosynthesis polyprenyl glycosylphosphotransferase
MLSYERALLVVAVVLLIGAVFAIFERRSAPGEAVAIIAAWACAAAYVDRRRRAWPLVLDSYLTATSIALLGAGTASLAIFWLPGTSIEPLHLALLAGAVFVVTLGFEKIARRLRVAHRILIVGAPDRGARQVIADLRKTPGCRFACVGVICDRTWEAEDVLGVPVLGGPWDLTNVIEATRPSLVVLAEPDIVIFDGLLDAASQTFRALGLSEFYEHAFGKVPVRHLAKDPAWFMSILHLYRRQYPRATKRALDIALATLGLVLAAPLFPLLGLLVLASGEGPVFYRQVRVGEHGKLFHVVKFRTMMNGAEQPGAPAWAQPDDPRVTPVGRIMRALWLDEVPQLWTVLRGEMSMVGPRPERPEFLALLEREVPFWKRRDLVKPGLSGWAQVNFRYAADTESMVEKLSFDLYYLKYRSLLLDLVIVAKTVRLVLAHGRTHGRLADNDRVGAEA